MLVILSGVSGAGKDTIKKELIKRIVIEAEKTGDDMTCLDICKVKNGRIHISWLGKRKEEIDIRKLDETGFFIGTGEGLPDLSLLDELSE